MAVLKTDVLIVGGGLAGLVSALELARAGHQVTLVERKTYPFHKVCGEYVSNEVRPYIESLGVDLGGLGAATIRRFQVSSPSGRLLNSPLDLGGFGISRYALDHELYKLGCLAGVNFVLGKQVDDIVFESSTHPENTSEQPFSIVLSDGQLLTSRQVIGSFGKRSKLDKVLNRAFASRSDAAQRSGYIGVKYHVAMDYPRDVIALHNFADGYCGMSAIEANQYCMCYLTTRENLRKFGNIPAMEQAILHRNPHLKAVFETADFLYDRPEVINDISFAPKRAVENHILMAGDSAGLITPLCGNGMAMAIHGAKLVSSLTGAFLQNRITRPELEQYYQRGWSQRFARRLWVGRTVQKLFGNETLTEGSIRLFGLFRPALRSIMRQTHGEVIQ